MAMWVVFHPLGALIAGCRLPGSVGTRQYPQGRPQPGGSFCFTPYYLYYTRIAKLMREPSKRKDPKRKRHEGTVYIGLDRIVGLREDTFRPCR